MAVYGLDFYGQQVYGSPGLLTHDASPFVATPYDYGVLDITWFLPKTLTPTTSLFRLVRNQFGFPEGVWDGAALIGSDASPMLLSGAPTRFIDSGLPEGTFQYYSIFVTDTTLNTWFRAGDAIGLSVKNWKYSEVLYDWLPTPYKISDIFDGTNTAVNYDLINFLSLFGFQANRIRTEISLISGPYDIDNVSIKLLPAILNQFGIGFENAITYVQARQMVRHAAFFYKWKGTKVAAKKYSEALTGWGVQIKDGKNLVLDRNDASAEESIGRWFNAQRATITRVTAPNPYLEVTSPSGFPNGTAGMFLITASSGSATYKAWGGSDITWGSSSYTWSGVDITSLPAIRAALPNPTNIRNTGIPVQASTSYTASIQVARPVGSIARSALFTLAWYDKTGTFISQVDSSTVAITEGWGSRPTVTATSPSNAVWLGLVFSVLAAVDGETFYMDATQVERASSATPYEDPRLINVVLKPVKENLCTTPVFSINTGSWYTNNIALPTADVSVSTDVGAWIPGGTKSLKFTEVSAGTQTGIIQAKMTGNVRPNTAITFSAYVKHVNALSGRIMIQFVDDPTIYQTPFTLASGWVRPYVSALSPSPTLLSFVSLAANIVTLTTSINHGYIVGQEITVTNTGIPFDGTYVVTSVTSNTLSYVRVYDNISYRAIYGGYVEGMRPYTATVEITGTVGTVVGYLDGVMIEPLSSLYTVVPNTSEMAPGAFFNGSINMGDVSDTFYLGVPQASISVFYPNKVVKYYRLRQTLARYLPAGCDFKLTFASRYAS